MTHPANWTEFQVGALATALTSVGLDVELLTEPAAAALDYAAATTVPGGCAAARVRPRRRHVRRRPPAARAARVSSTRSSRSASSGSAASTSTRRCSTSSRHACRPSTCEPPGSRRRASPRWPTSGASAWTPRRRCRRIPPPTCPVMLPGLHDDGADHPRRVRGDDPPDDRPDDRGGRPTRWAGRSRAGRPHRGAAGRGLVADPARPADGGRPARRRRCASTPTRSSSSPRARPAAGRATRIGAAPAAPPLDPVDDVTRATPGRWRAAGRRRRGRRRSWPSARRCWALTRSDDDPGGATPTIGRRRLVTVATGRGPAGDDRPRPPRRRGGDADDRRRPDDRRAADDHRSGGRGVSSAPWCPTQPAAPRRRGRRRRRLGHLGGDGDRCSAAARTTPVLPSDTVALRTRPLPDLARSPGHQIVAADDSLYITQRYANAVARVSLADLSVETIPLDGSPFGAAGARWHRSGSAPPHRGWRAGRCSRSTAPRSARRSSCPYSPGYVQAIDGDAVGRPRSVPTCSVASTRHRVR